MYHIPILDTIRVKTLVFINHIPSMHILTITMVDIIGKITIYGLICSLFISFYRDKRLNTFVFQEREDIDLFILEC